MDRTRKRMNQHKEGVNSDPNCEGHRPAHSPGENTLAKHINKQDRETAQPMCIVSPNVHLVITVTLIAMILAISCLMLTNMERLESEYRKTGVWISEIERVYRHPADLRVSLQSFPELHSYIRENSITFIMVKEQIDSLATQVGSLLAWKSITLEDIEALRSNVLGVTSTVKEHKYDTDEFRRKADTASAGLRNEISDLMKDAETLTRDTSVLRDQLITVTNSLLCLEGNVSRGKLEIQKTSQKHDDQIKKFQDETLPQMKNELTNLRDDISELRKERKTLTTNISALREEINPVSNRLLDLDGHVSSLRIETQQQFKKHANQIENIQDDTLPKMETETAHLRGDISDLRDDMKTGAMDADALREELMTVSTRLLHLVGTVSAVSLETQRKFEKHGDQINNIQDTLPKMETETNETINILTKTIESNKQKTDDTLHKHQQLIAKCQGSLQPMLNIASNQKHDLKPLGNKVDKHKKSTACQKQTFPGVSSSLGIQSTRSLSDKTDPTLLHQDCLLGNIPYQQTETKLRDLEGTQSTIKHETERKLHKYEDEVKHFKNNLIQTFQTEIDTTEKNLSKLTVTVETNKLKTNDRLRQNEKSITKIESNLRTWQNDLIQLQNSLNIMERKADTYNKEKDDHIQNIQGHFQTLFGRVVQDKENIDNTQSVQGDQIKDILQKQLPALQRDVNEARNKADGAGSMASEINLALRDHKAWSSAKQSKYEEDLRKLKNNIDSATNSLASLENKLDKTTIELDDHIQNSQENLKTLLHSVAKNKDDTNKTLSVQGGQIEDIVQQELPDLRRGVYDAKNKAEGASSMASENQQALGVHKTWTEARQSEYEVHHKEVKVKLRDIVYKQSVLHGQIDEMRPKMVFHDAGFWMGLLSIGCCVLMFVNIMKTYTGIGQTSKIERMAVKESRSGGHNDNYCLKWIGPMESSVCVVVFHSETERQHTAQTRSLFQSVGDTPPLIHTRIIRHHSDIQGLPGSRIFLVFVDFNERNVILEDPEKGLGDLRITTVRSLWKFGGDVTVIYCRDHGSRKLDGELFNRDLSSIYRQAELTQLKNQQRMLSIFEGFSDIQKRHCRNFINKQLN